MRSTFNALILQLLIFKSTLILLALKNTKKIRKTKIKKKRKENEKLRDQFGSLGIFLL